MNSFHGGDESEDGKQVLLIVASKLIEGFHRQSRPGVAHGLELDFVGSDLFLFFCEHF